MKKRFGFDLAKSQIRDFVDDEIEDFVERFRIGDSEIEKLFFVSLKLLTRFGASEFTSVVLVQSEEDEARTLSDVPQWIPPIFCVRPQATIMDYRVDFLIHAEDQSKINYSNRRERNYRRLVVECDGHDFHERTKEQAARDRSRDRDLVTAGYEVFRFTGSELWTDPFGCAQQVLQWGVRTW